MKKTVITLCVLGMSTFLVAQDKPADAPKKDAPAPAKKADAAPGAEKKQDAAKPSADAEKMMVALANKLTTTDALIRDMSEAALLKAGKVAVPTLNVLVSGQDKPLADAAKKLIERIERGAETPAVARGARGGDANERMDKLVKDLNLDEKKTQKLKDMQTSARERMTEIMDSVRNGEMSREEAGAAMQEARDEMKNDLKKSGFSDDEIKKIEESFGGGMRRGGGMGGGNRRGGGGG